MGLTFDEIKRRVLGSVEEESPMPTLDFESLKKKVLTTSDEFVFSDNELAERSKLFQYNNPNSVPKNPINRIELDSAGKPILPKFEEKTIFDVLDEREAKKQEEQAAFAKRATENLGPGKSILCA